MSPSFSPEGQKIAFFLIECDFVRYLNKVAVQNMNSDGTNLTQLGSVKLYDTPDFPIGFGRSIKGSLCWTPVGKKILFTVPTEKMAVIFVINFDGLGLTRVTDNCLAYDDLVSWSGYTVKLPVNPNFFLGIKFVILQLLWLRKSNSFLNATHHNRKNTCGYTL